MKKDNYYSEYNGWLWLIPLIGWWMIGDFVKRVKNWFYGK